MFLEYHNLNPLAGQDIHGLLLANIYFKIIVEQRTDMNARFEQVDKRFGQTAVLLYPHPDPPPMGEGGFLFLTPAEEVRTVH